jgi:predicted nucleic acid-binding protein
MTPLLDTDVLIDCLRNRAPAIRLVSTLLDEGSPLGSVVTRAEVLAGQREHERSATEAMLAAIAWIPVSKDVADRAGALARRYPRPGVRFAVADYLIAATAQLLGASLLTRNVRHFPMFRDLQAPYSL